MITSAFRESTTTHLVTNLRWRARTSLPPGENPSRYPEPQLCTLRTPARSLPRSSNVCRLPLRAAAAMGGSTAPCGRLLLLGWSTGHSRRGEPGVRPVAQLGSARPARHRPHRRGRQAHLPSYLLFPWTLPLGGRRHSPGVSTAMGFAALETMGYGFMTLLQSQGNLLLLDEVLLARGLTSPAGHAAWTGLVCAVLWRERKRAGRVAVNGKVLGAFATAVVLHALWDTFSLLRGVTFVESVSLELVSLFIALVSLMLLIRRIREARREESAYRQ